MKTSCFLIKDMLKKLKTYMVHNNTNLQVIFLHVYFCTVEVFTSVADPGCLSRIRVFSIPDPVYDFFPIPDLHKIIKYDPGCSSRIRILIFYPSRILNPGV
jgi:hypothetical protein